MKNSLSILGSLLAMSICILNLEVHAGINKKDFKSKTVSELIDVLENDELIERKVLEKIDKKLMCKIKLSSLPESIRFNKENLKNTAKSFEGMPQQYMVDIIKQTEQATINHLKQIDKYCP